MTWRDVGAIYWTGVALTLLAYLVFDRNPRGVFTDLALALGVVCWPLAWLWAWNMGRRGR